jgi:hypothetical protein
LLRPDSNPCGVSCHQFGTEKKSPGTETGAELGREEMLAVDVPQDPVGQPQRWESLGNLGATKADAAGIAYAVERGWLIISGGLHSVSLTEDGRQRVKQPPRRGNTSAAKSARGYAKPRLSRTPGT